MVYIQMTQKARLIAVLWPSFVCAGAFAGIVFAFIDPIIFAQSLGLESTPRLAGYSITFLFFWALGSISTFAGIAILRTPEIDPLG